MGTKFDTHTCHTYVCMFVCLFVCVLVIIFCYKYQQKLLRQLRGKLSAAGYRRQQAAQRNTISPTAVSRLPCHTALLLPTSSVPPPTPTAKVLRRRTAVPPFTSY